MSTALITAAIAASGIIVGWFVIGTQRVGEELTKERRSAYAEVLSKAAVIAVDRKADTDEFSRAVRAAEFLSSRSMYEAQRLPALLDRIGTPEWQREVDWFRELARFESHRNASMYRWWRRHWYNDRGRVPSRDRASNRTDP